MKNLAAKTINELHSSMVKNTVETAIKIGQLLTEQKKKIPFGDWEAWKEDNLDFSSSTAKRYVQCYENREEIKSLKLTDLSAVYKWYKKAPKKPNEIHRDNDNRREIIRHLFAHQNHKFKNPSAGKYLNEIIQGDVIDVLKKMVKDIPNSIHLVTTSIPYNNGLDYGPSCQDNKPYQEYLDWIGEVISLCYELLVPGGRIIVNCDNMTNKEKEEEGEFTYKHALDCDIRYKVRQLKLEGMLEYQDIIWYKYNTGGAKIQCYGSFASPSKPNLRNCKEHFIVWSKQDYKLPKPKNIKPDITKEEFEEWSYNVWAVHPNARGKCPHPCTWTTKITDRLVKYFSFPSQTILDPFTGSGTALLSAKNTNRNFIGVDLNHNYCQWSRDRLDGKNMDKVYDDFLESKKEYLLKNHHDLFAPLFKKKKAKESKSAKKKLVVSKLKKNVSLKKKENQSPKTTNTKKPA